MKIADIFLLNAGIVFIFGLSIWLFMKKPKEQLATMHKSVEFGV